MTEKALLMQSEVIENKIFLVRGKKVMFDRDLAVLYGVTTGNLNKAVSRNIERFPEDFMLLLTKEEHDSLRFQIGILKRGEHSKYPPRAFTQEGIAMLSGILRSERAVKANIAIMRAFVRLREMLASNKELAKRLDEMEKRYDSQFKGVFDAIRQLMVAPEPKKKKIGF